MPIFGCFCQDTSFGTLQNPIRHTVIELLTVDQNCNKQTQAPFIVDVKKILEKDFQWY